MNTLNDIRAKMEKINNFIIESEITILGGTMVDLSGLDKDVTVICQKALTLPPEEAREIQPLMAAMIGNLEKVSIALNNFKEDLKK